MKIAIVLSTPIPPVEGIGNHVYNIAKRFCQEGHEVVIITRGGMHPTELDHVDGIPVYRPPYFKTYPFHVHVHGLFATRLVRRLEDKLDILNIQSPYCPVIKTSLPLAVNFHNPLKVDARYVKVVSPLTLAIKLFPIVTAGVEKALLRKANILLGISQAVAREFQEYGANPSSFHLVGNGVDQRLFVAPERESGSYVLYVGRLAPRKGLFILIRAAAQVVRARPDARFLIVGTGPFENRLKEQVSRLGLEGSVRFIGHLGHQSPELVKVFQDASLFVQPSEYEGVPGALLEAMACARPIVSTNVSALPEVVTDEVDGLLVPPSDPQALTEAILRLLEGSELRRRLGRQARTTVEERFTWEAVAGRYLKYFDECVKSFREASR